MPSQHPAVPAPLSTRTSKGGASADPSTLLAQLGLPPLSGADPAPDFPLRVPPEYVAAMRRGDRDDPLLRQVLPLLAEREATPGYREDPVGDGEAVVIPGVLQKYRGRALLVVTGACPIHCRYCFRRHFDYGDHALGGARRQEVLEWLGRNGEIHEVILSGGDPLMLSAEALRRWMGDLSRIGHLRRIRIHTRVPVVAHRRVGEALIDAMVDAAAGQGPARVMVIHCNHPQELTPQVRGVLRRLRGAGLTLLNQAVLLAGVNDRLDTLIDLSEGLFEAGVLPYYLHQLDPVQGAAHFQVPDVRARTLVEGLREGLPGYLVPRLVREVPGAASKTPL